MGQYNSRSEEELEKKERELEENRILLEQQEEQLRKAQMLEKHFHEQKLQEEARLKKVQDEWQREQYLKQPKQQCEQQNPQWQQNVQQQQQQQLCIEKQQFQQHASIPQSSSPSAPFETQIFTPPIISPPVKPLKIKASATSKIYPDLKSPSNLLHPLIAPSTVTLDAKPYQTKVSVKTKSSIDAKSQPSDTPETYLARLATSNVRFVEWTEIDYIQESNHISRSVAENIVKLLNDDNTIPFIARYRKSMTEGMDADELQSVKNSLDRAKLMKQKANAIIKEIDKQGKWTAEFHAFVQGTKSLNDLEHIHSVFNITKGTLAKRARDLGLGIPAQAIIKGERVDPLYWPVQTKREGLKNEEPIRDGIICILADMIIKDERTRDKIRKLRSENPMQIQTTKIMSKDKEGKKPSKKMEKNGMYDRYHDFSAFENKLKPHEILAIYRGEERKVLSTVFVIPDSFEQGFKEHCTSQYRYALNASPLHKNMLTAAFDDVWNELRKLSLIRTIHEFNERAETASMDVYADNVKQIFLTAPVRGKFVLGLQPGFRHGCTMAVVSEQGDLLETETIYPHESNCPKTVHEAECTLVRMVVEHKCTIIALGNGTACRETEVFLSGLIKKRAFGSLSVVYAIVDQTEASKYCGSREAKNEFPDFDANVVSAVFIARRLQDPMAELVKLDPKHLGVGIDEYDLPGKQLAVTLNDVIMEVVSFVGVDVNTASSSLLKRVAGLDESKAKSIIDFRETSGPFRTRKDLMKVHGIDNKTFEQCAGFIRIMPETAGSNERRAAQEPLNYLDQTWIHPESYDIANAFVAAAKCNPDQLGTNGFIFAVAIYASQGYEMLAKKFKTSVETIEMIVKGLSIEKGQDIRPMCNETMFRQSLMSFHDWQIGTILTGVVRNRMHFGVFVDIGIENDGLLLKNCMGGMTVNIGQRVQVEVTSRDKEHLRLGLTLINCL